MKTLGQVFRAFGASTIMIQVGGAPLLLSEKPSGISLPHLRFSCIVKADGLICGQSEAARCFFLHT